MGEFKRIIPAEISSWFPSGNSGEMNGCFLCGYFRLLSLWNPWGYFHMGISLVLPSKFQNAIQWPRKGPSYVKISQWWLDVILWWIKMCTSLANLSSHFNPDLKFFPESLHRFSFHMQTKFLRGVPQPTTTIPGDSLQNLQDFARWKSDVQVIIQ
mgnify:CR=1 FL=1